METSQIIWSVATALAAAFAALFVFVPTGKPRMGVVRDRTGATVAGATATARRNGASEIIIRALGLLFFVGTCVGLRLLYDASTSTTSSKPEGNTFTVLLILFLASFAAFIVASVCRTPWEPEVTVGGAVRNDVSVDQTPGDNYTVLRLIAGLVVASVFAFGGPELWKSLPSITGPSGYGKYKEVPMPVDAGGQVRWHKEDLRKVSFPVITDVRWYLIHDEAPNGEWIRVNTDNPAVWKVEMVGGRFEYTFKNNLNGVKVGFINTSKQERTERLEMVAR